MPTHPSAQTDRFVHDRLPPPDQWPDQRCDLPELQALPAQINVVQVLFDRAFANGHADRPFLRSDERTLTYAQARAEVNRFTDLLAQMDLQPANRVLLRGGNSIAMALAWLAVVQSGLIAVATMPLLRATELKAIIDKARPSAALCDDKLQDELKAALAQGPDTAGMPLRLFNTGDAGDSCLVQRDNQGYPYKFLGGRPGWQQTGQAPTQETELLISSDGRRVLSVIYNGSPR